jgi:hypothetical protein
MSNSAVEFLSAYDDKVAASKPQTNIAPPERSLHKTVSVAVSLIGNFIGIPARCERQAPQKE